MLKNKKQLCLPTLAGDTTVFFKINQIDIWNKNPRKKQNALLFCEKPAKYNKNAGTINLTCVFDLNILEW
ncbi:hypothetical protein HMPREF1141_2468 [Clostridium sp. MSTE9]|nr:hypothetical protein HMPREF1141_2468 [Clostridium sp. MSTE9]